MTEKRFISKGESIINVDTDELVNASSEESAEIIIMWLNEQHETIQELKSSVNEQIRYNEEQNGEFQKLYEYSMDMEKILDINVNKRREAEFTIIDMLDYIKKKGTVSHQEMEEWWNNRFE